jgi:hypothetical protein
MSSAKYYEKLREAYKSEFEKGELHTLHHAHEELKYHLERSIMALHETDAEVLYKVIQRDFEDCSYRALQALALLGLIRINYDENNGLIGDKITACNADMFTVLAFNKIYPEGTKTADPDEEADEEGEVND